MRRRIFVFGSNLQGYHGAGAARAAVEQHGARFGVAEGLTGEAYALPTCAKPGVPLDLEGIEASARVFVKFAEQHPEMDFLLTAVGCGFAGYTPAQILPLFGRLPDNVYVQAKLVQS